MGQAKAGPLSDANKCWANCTESIGSFQGKEWLSNTWKANHDPSLANHQWDKPLLSHYWKAKIRLAPWGRDSLGPVEVNWYWAALGHWCARNGYPCSGASHQLATHGNPGMIYHGQTITGYSSLALESLSLTDPGWPNAVGQPALALVHAWTKNGLNTGRLFFLESCIQM